MLEQYSDWPSVCRAVLLLRHGVDLRLDKAALPHPSQIVAFRQSPGLGVKHTASWRGRLTDGRSLHVLEFDDRYEAHWDSRDPADNFLAHLLDDTPRLAMGITMLSGAALGGAVGALSGGSAASGGVVGALGGLWLGIFGLGPGAHRVVSEVQEGALVGLRRAA